MDKNKTINTQIIFLKRIEDVLPGSTSLVHEIAELLEISTDSAYRRIRGETLLSIDEIIKLCDNFNISFDAFSRAETGLVTFAYKGLDNKSENLLEYLKDVHFDLEKITNVPNSHIIYACQDIPVFYHYNHKEIAAFKFFYWLKSIINAEGFETSKYKPEIVNSEIFDTAKKIFKLYTKVKSTEIWTDTTIQSTLKQIHFYWESGLFENKTTAINVCESLKEEIYLIQNQADASSKLIDTQSDTDSEHTENYNLYLSDIEITNNCVLIDLISTKAVYLSHFSFFTMKTMNARYAEITSEWLNSLIKKTTLISGVSEKNRYQFFNRCIASIDNLIETINKD